MQALRLYSKGLRGVVHDFTGHKDSSTGFRPLIEHKAAGRRLSIPCIQASLQREARRADPVYCGPPPWKLIPKYACILLPLADIWTRTSTWRQSRALPAESPLRHTASRSVVPVGVLCLVSGDVPALIIDRGKLER